MERTPEPPADVPAQGAPPGPVWIRFRDTVEIQPMYSNVQKQHAVLQCGGRSFAVSRRAAELAQLIIETPLLSDLCARVNQTWGTEFGAEELHGLVKKTLGPLLQTGDEAPAGGASNAPPAANGTAKAAAKDGGRPSEAKSMLFTFQIIPERYARVLARLTSVFYQPVVAAILLPVALFCAVAALVKGVAFSTRISAEYLLTGYLVSFTITIFHELGHAAALWRYFRRSGPVYGGLLFIIPAMFIKADAAWSGRRLHRFMVDVGGVYFQVLAFIPLYLLQYVPGYPPALYQIGLTLNIITIITNINPLWNFDAYWMLSTALGVPNLSRTAADALKGVITRVRRPQEVWRPLTHARLDVALAAYSVVRRTVGTFFVMMLVWHLPALFSYTFDSILKAGRAMGLAAKAGLSVTHVYLVVKSLMASLTFVLLMRFIVKSTVHAGQMARVRVRRLFATARS